MSFASFALEFIYKLYLSSRLLLLASQRCRFLFVDISDVHHCYVVPIVTFRTSADVCSYGQTFCFVYVHGFHYAFELLSRLVFVFLYDIIRGYRILLVQAECSIIKLSFPFLSTLSFGNLGKLLIPILIPIILQPKFQV